MKLSVIDADYTLENGKGVILLWCKDEKGNTVLVRDRNFKAYFYVLPKKEANIERIIEKISSLSTPTPIQVGKDTLLWEGEERTLIKVKVENPRRLKDVRDLIKEWEEVEDTFGYDFTLPKRYLIDKQISPTGWIEVSGDKKGNTIEAREVKPIECKDEPPLKILALDTEFTEENKEDRLIMFSYAISNGKKGVVTSWDWPDKPKYVKSVENEKQIILELVRLIKEEDPDIIVGYNTDGFDFPKLRERAEKYKIDLKLGRDGSKIKTVRRGRVSASRLIGRPHLDLFVFVQHILSPTLKSEVLSLDEVARELIGEGKTGLTYKQLMEIWKQKKQMELLTEYSLNDAVITYKLSEVLLPQIFAVSRITGLLPFDACRYTYSQLVEAFYMRKAFLDKVLVPNKPKQDEIEKRKRAPAYKGAIVIEPKQGIHQNILVWDFRSLYPSIIVTHNIDPWTLNVKKCKHKIKVPENDFYFCGDSQGFIPKHLQELIELRQKLKKKLKKLKKDTKEYKLLYNEQYALKIIANATYGYMGFFSARWYRRECGIAAAAFGRYYITKVIEEAKKSGFQPIYGDTDSLMALYPSIENKEELEKIGKEFAEKVNKKLPGIIELEYRGLYKRGIFVGKERGKGGAKKRYALLDYNDEMEIRGFETVRRDWCALAKKVQRKVLEIVLKESNPKKAVEYVRSIINDLKNRKIEVDDLVIYEQITRDLSQYEQIGPHVKAAIKARSRGFIIPVGTVIGFVITKGPGSISDRAELVQFLKDKEYDAEYYINHQILPAALRVLKALGYTEEKILSGSSLTSLGTFLKKKS